MKNYYRILKKIALAIIIAIAAAIVGGVFSVFSVWFTRQAKCDTTSLLKS